MTGPRTRRDFLRTGGLALCGLAGCLGGSDRPEGKTSTAGTTDESVDPTARTTQRTTTDTPTGPLAAVTPGSVRSSFFYLTSPDSLDVAASEGQQFVFVTVEPTADSPPSLGAFSLVADGREFSATTTPGSMTATYLLYDQGHVYDPEDGRTGWLAFEVPNPLDAEEVVVTVDGYERSLGEGFLADLRAPPAEFELASFHAPDSVTADETFEISFAVRNVGDADGTFRACLNESGPAYVPHRVELSVPAGERRAWSRAFGSRVYEDTDASTYRFRSPVEDRDVTVEVVSGTATETSDAGD